MKGKVCYQLCEVEATRATTPVHRPSARQQRDVHAWRHQRVGGRNPAENCLLEALCQVRCRREDRKIVILQQHTVLQQSYNCGRKLERCELGGNVCCISQGQGWATTTAELDAWVARLFGFCTEAVVADETRVCNKRWRREGQHGLQVPQATPALQARAHERYQDRNRLHEATQYTVTTKKNWVMPVM